MSRNTSEYVDNFFRGDEYSKFKCKQQSQICVLRLDENLDSKRLWSYGAGGRFFPSRRIPVLPGLGGAAVFFGHSGNGGHLFGGHFGGSILQIGHSALVGFSKHCLLS